MADVIAFAATRPSHVNLDQIVLKPRAQASATRAHRSEPLSRAAQAQSGQAGSTASQLSVQSQMSPSCAESLTGVPVTSTGSP